MTNRPTIRSAGFSLVELMIAMVLGLILVGSAITVFSSTVRSSNLNQTLANLQANARYALERISADVRVAGFQGCSSASQGTLAISTNPSPVTDLRHSALSGFAIGNSAWSPSKPADYTPPTGYGEPVPGTHALRVQFAVSPGAVISNSMSNAGADIDVPAVKALSSVSAGDLMLISDCTSADLFKVNAINGTTNRAIKPTQILSRAYKLTSATAQTVRVMPFSSAIYYVGDTQRKSQDGDDVRSLFVQGFPYNLTSNPPMELVEGVDQMRLLLGTRKSDGTLQYYQPDDAAVSAQAIESVRVGLLMTSNQRYRVVDNARVYTLANQRVTSAAAGGTVQYPADKRVRFAYSANISSRNRSLEGAL